MTTVISTRLQRVGNCTFLRADIWNSSHAYTGTGPVNSLEQFSAVLDLAFEYLEFDYLIFAKSDFNYEMQVDL